MICRLPTVTRRVMSWSFVLVSMTVPLHVSAAQRVVGIIADQGVGALPDSTHLVAAMAASLRMRSPASFALSRKSELMLSAEQVAAVEARVPLELDSLRARTERLMLAMRKTTTSSAMTLQSWTGPIDEAAIRAASCAQSQMQTDLAIGMLRDRHALGELLTPAQREAFDRLQSEAMMEALRGATRNK